MPMPSDMYGAVSDRSGSDGAEEPIAEYIAKAYYVTHNLQTMRFFIAQIRSAGYICLYGFLLAGGDGVDSNSRSSYDGILFSGGWSVIISTGNADSSIDTEAGYRYTGGLVCAVGRSGGMSRESTMCGNFSEIGKTASVSLTAGGYLVVSDVVTLKSPVSMNGFVVLLGNTTAGVSVKTSVTAVCDGNGVAWN